MEYLDGQSLAHRLRGGALPCAQVLELGMQIADALASAHHHGIVHRDLKPANIMLTKSGAKLLDFGLAKLKPQPSAAAAGASALSTKNVGTRPGVVMGTVPYMAPEQLEGKETDARTDLFAFGVRALRDAHGAARVRRRHRGERGLGDHDGRAGTAVHAAAADAAGALVVMAAGAFALRPLVGPRSSAADVASRQLTTSSTWDADPAISPAGDLVAFSSGEAGSANIWVVHVTGGTPMRVTDGPGWDSSPAWFPDGSQIAFVSDRLGGRAIWKVSLVGAATLLVPDAEDPAISPDGGRIAFVRAGPGGDRRVFVAPLSDVASANLVTRDGDGLDDHVRPSWSPDGRTICYNAHRDLWRVSASGGRARRLSTESDIDREPVWSPDGTRIAFTSNRGGKIRIWLMPVSNGRPGGPARQVSSGSGAHQLPAWSPDGTRLAYLSIEARGQTEVWTVNADWNGSPTRVTTGARALDVRWSTNPDRLFVNGFWDGVSASLRSISPAGGDARLLAEPLGRDPSSAVFDISRDGSVLVLTAEKRRGNIFALEAASRIY